jgi:hypothetical protein
VTAPRSPVAFDPVDGASMGMECTTGVCSATLRAVALDTTGGGRRTAGALAVNFFIDSSAVGSGVTDGTGRVSRTFSYTAAAYGAEVWLSMCQRGYRPTLAPRFVPLPAPPQGCFQVRYYGYR